jgi:hypothetical protein
MPKEIFLSVNPLSPSGSWLVCSGNSHACEWKMMKSQVENGITLCSG